MNRRRFLCRAGRWTAALSAATLTGCAGTRDDGLPWSPRPHPAAEEWKGRVGVATGGSSPSGRVRAAVEKLCGPEGFGAFIRAGDTVVVKPNIGWPQPPEMAANTDPEVVAAVVEMAREAGAARVRVFDNSISTATQAYAFSGIETAARAAGAEVLLCAPHRFHRLRTEDPDLAPALAPWPVYRAALEADVLIDVAVAKTHNLTAVTLCMKNLMGLLGGDRGKMHPRIGTNLAHLAAACPPTFSILDATRLLARSGPSGGRTDFVVPAETIVCGTSPVTVDAWAADAAHLPWPAGHPPAGEIEHIARGAAAGLGIADPARIEVAA